MPLGDDQLAAAVRFHVPTDHSVLELFTDPGVALRGDDLDLVLEVLAEAGRLFVLDRLRPLVLLHSLAGEDLDVDHRSADPRRDGEGRIPHVLRLLAKDGPEQPLLGGEDRLPLWGDLPHQDVTRFDLGPDTGDPALVQVLQGLLAHVGDVPGNLFLT